MTLLELKDITYAEHYHGLYGGIEVVPKSVVRIGKNGRYFSDFTLTTGRVGGQETDGNAYGSRTDA